MDILVLSVVREVAGKEDEVRPLRQRVDHVDRALESLGAKWIGRPVETNVCVAQLHEGKRGQPLSAGAPERGEHVTDLACGECRGVGGIKHADAERRAGDF